MSLTNPDKLVTEERLNEYHNTILPYLGGMPDILANKFSRGDMYSTDEKMIGQWIDGKPVYQNTIILPNHINIKGPDGTTITSVSQYNIEALVDCVCYGVPKNEDISTKIYQRVAFPMEIRLVTTNQTLIGAVSANNIWVCALTIRYTKTTDSPVAIGIDTDYSTDEKIVGTWIDGKPIYQKTIIRNGTISIGSNKIYPNIEADVIVNIRGMIFRETYYTNIVEAQSVNQLVNTYYNKSDRSICIDTNMVYTNATAWVTIQYTKTTD